MVQWPTSGGLTCMPHGVAEGGGSTVDYILGPREATHLITSFTIPPIPIGADHTYLSFSITGDTIPHSSTAHTPHTTIHFTHELASLYSAEVEHGLCLLHPSTPLSVLTSHISSVLHTSAISSFPHTTHTGRTPPPPGLCLRTAGMMMSAESYIDIYEHDGPWERSQRERLGDK